MTEDRDNSRSDFDQLNQELQGLDGMQAPRFLSEDSHPRSRKAAERKARDRAFQRQLDLLLQDPQFAAAYERVGTLLDDAQEILSTQAAELAASAERLESVLEDIEARTTKLPDGTAIYRTASGDYVTADKRALTDAEVLLLVNPEDAVSIETYTQASDALKTVRKKQDDLSNDQDKVDDFWKRRDEVESPEELEDLEEDIKTFTSDLKENAALKSTFSAKAEPASLQDLGELEISAAGVQPAGQTR